MIWTLNQLFWQRAIDEDQTPLLAFPRTKHGVSDFEQLSGATLYRLVNGAVKCLIDKGFPVVVRIYQSFSHEASFHLLIRSVELTRNLAHLGD